MHLVHLRRAAEKGFGAQINRHVADKRMNQPSGKTIMLLLVGGALLIAGAATPLLHSAGLWRFSWVLVLIGLALVRLARPSLKMVSPRKSVEDGHFRRREIRIFEFLIYSIAGVLTVTVIGAAYMGYFNDLLTDAFCVALVASVFFWFARRLFHIF